MRTGHLYSAVSNKREIVGRGKAGADVIVLFADPKVSPRFFATTPVFRASRGPECKPADPQSFSAAYAKRLVPDMYLRL